jgi:hypothetical protein
MFLGPAEELKWAVCVLRTARLRACLTYDDIAIVPAARKIFSLKKRSFKVSKEVVLVSNVTLSRFLGEWRYSSRSS